VNRVKRQSFIFNAIIKPVKQQSLPPEHKWLYFFIGLAVLANFSGLFVPLMDPDAGVYASVSKNMLLRNNYWELYFQGNDWLDKPHFPFWLTAYFFKLFGVHTWVYKLPGILLVLIGAHYTYLLAKQLYNQTIALWAVFILLTAEHIIISNNDVRAEPFLTGLIIASIYHFYNSLNRKINWHLVAASFFAACAVMTKGPFTLIPVGGAIAGELIIKRNWKQLFHWKWLIALVLIGIFITPELYSLWYQFDSHPEKIVFGKTNVSGIRFFLWDSQFGRFLNKTPMKGKGDPSFFLHTLLWAFLPWSLLMYASLVERIKNGSKKLNYKNEEWLTVCGSLLTLLIFSLSKFQLSYYTNIIFPLFAILTAQYIFKLRSGIFSIIQNVITGILLVGGVLLQIFYSPSAPPLILQLIIICLLILILILPRLYLDKKLLAFYRVGLASLVINLYINWFFYPDLLKYQSGSEAAFYINEKHPNIPGVVMSVYSPVFEFYLRDGWSKSDTSILYHQPEPGILYIMQEELDFINQRGIHYEMIKELDEFHVTMLSLKFINKKTRSKELKKHYLIKLL
jgi:4-amino-4-deoxy-L-arabinose transferase-like glycosyltransferase